MLVFIVSLLQCDKHNALLIADEVQCGLGSVYTVVFMYIICTNLYITISFNRFGKVSEILADIFVDLNIFRRTGNLWTHDVDVDIMTLAKPLAGGIPIGEILLYLCFHIYTVCNNVINEN